MDIKELRKNRLDDLKVGDKVYVREDLKVFRQYGDDTFMPEMKTGLQEVKKRNN